METIEEGLGIKIHPSADATIRSPGALRRHYAPKAPLRLSCDDPKPGESLLAFGPNVPEGFSKVLNLSPAGNTTLAAANLFSYLHRLDSGNSAGIAVMPIPDRGLGRAINDRLTRAARK
jgi:L-threonylcarbamoyladenylate synthase